MATFAGQVKLLRTDHNSAEPPPGVTTESPIINALDPAGNERPGKAALSDELARATAAGDRLDSNSMLCGDF